jgi:hypothetical protein
MAAASNPRKAVVHWSAHGHVRKAVARRRGRTPSSAANTVHLFRRPPLQKHGELSTHDASITD